MSQWEVMYKVYDDSTKRSYSGPSHYTTLIEAFDMYSASQMVKNMNGADRTDILHCILKRQ